MTHDDTALARIIHDIALDAGNLIMDVYAKDFDVDVKKDASPVTEADAKAEALILERLRAATPSIPIVAEEQAAAGEIPEVADGPFWLVDPLDGTKEFISKNGEFTVNIALVRDGKPALGVVHTPAKNTTYLTTGTDAAVRIVDGGEPEPIQCRPAPEDGFVVVASKSHLTPETKDWLDKQPVKSMTQAGSSLKFCLLAVGEADVYPRLGRTMEWDTAAGHAVLSAAGGRVVTMDGQPLTYGKRPVFDNPHFVAWSH